MNVDLEQLRLPYDWEFRPQTYFPETPAPREEPIPEGLRRALGAMHPSLMGGLYLPPRAEGEVEIARVSLASVTADQISIRARPVKGGIAYAICDEYESDYALHPRRSKRPLTMGQLARLIDSSTKDGGIVFGAVKSNAIDGCCPPEELLGFATVSSPFYPELGNWYASWMDAYLVSLKAEEEWEGA